MSPPRVVILRGHHVTPWELKPWERLGDAFDVAVVVPGHHLFDTSALTLPRLPARTLADLLPAVLGRGVVARLPFNRHLGLKRRLRGADIVHAAELSFWPTAQAATLKRMLGFKLVATVWETIPFRDAGRHPLSRPNRRRALAAVDLFLAATERARDSLLLEGVETDRVVVAPPGVDTERFATARAAAPHRADPLVISPGRLVWEKGHQDVLRAIAALRRGLVAGPDTLRRAHVLVLGSGPEERRLRAYAHDLGLDSALELRASVPYDEMPAMYARASAMALASLPTRGWEEQFGMVLAEAMAAGLPIVTTQSGAIPEVVGTDATLVAPGDWMGIARGLAVAAIAERVEPDPARVARFGLEAAAARLRAAYGRVLR